MPGDPLTGRIIQGMDQGSMTATLGNPWYVRYSQWIGNMLNGDFGLSYTYLMPVEVLIGARLSNTLFSNGLSLLSYLIAVPLGICVGRFNDSMGDKVIRLLNSTGFALPIFIVALVLVWLFGFKLELFPTRGMPLLPEISECDCLYLEQGFYHVVLPALTFALSASAGNIQRLRSGIIEAKQEDYVLTARSKGVPEAHGLSEAHF